MKKFFRLFKWFTPVFFICYMLPSCSRSVIAITITGGDAGSGRLFLKDSIGNAADTIKVKPEQIIKWKIAKGANVSITELLEKPGSDNVLSKRARKKFLSKTWKAKVDNIDSLKERLKDKEIKDGEHEYYIEEYFIKWKDKKTGTTPIYDPRIQVKS